MFTNKPNKIRLEASSFCQLKCPSCPTTTKAIHPTIGSGFLKFKDFKQLIDQNPFIREIELSNYGEIFLNPDILKIMQYAYQHNVSLSANNGVNLNHIKANVLEGLVKYQFKSLSVSLDGIDNHTYQQYRVKGDFDRVIAHIKQINAYKQQYQSEYPQLLWQFIAFGHNEQVIIQAKQMADELGMQFGLKLSWSDEFSPVKNHLDVIRSFTGGVTSRNEFKQTHKVDYMQSLCHQLWDHPQINWDGKLLGCCRNFWGDFGSLNVFKDGLIKSLNHPKMKYARKMLMGLEPERADIPCTTCNIYIGMKANQIWLKRRPFNLLERILFFLNGFRK